MEFLNTVIRFFQDGGAFMYPIVLILVLGLAIAVERWLFLARSAAEQRGLWQRLQPLLSKNEWSQAAKLAADSDTALGRVLANGLSRALAGRSRPEIELAMEESLMEVMPVLEKRTHYLATLANIATLLGLLGTIIGLIKGFTAVANVNPAEKADLLSSAISVAMNTTAFGLMTAIPLLLLHAVLTTRTNEIVDSLEMAAIKVVNMVGTRSE